MLTRLMGVMSFLYIHIRRDWWGLSILRNLARKVGDRDELPADFIEAGEFEDPDTTSKIREEVGKLNIPLAIRKHLDGERDDKEGDDSNDDEDAEEADDN